MKKTNCPCKPPVRPRVELSDRTRLVPIPGLKAPVGPAEACFPTFCEDNQGSRYSPAKRVRWEKEEQRSKRFFAACGGNERYGACDDAKQDKALASEPGLPTPHLPAVRAERTVTKVTSIPEEKQAEDITITAKPVGKRFSAVSPGRTEEK